MILHTIKDVLPPSARQSSAAVDIIEEPIWRTLFKGTGDQIPLDLLARRVICIHFDRDNFGCHVHVEPLPIEKAPRPPRTLAEYGVSDDIRTNVR